MRSASTPHPSAQRHVCLALAILAALAANSPTNSAARDDAAAILLKKGFRQQWIDALAARGQPRIYSGKELDKIGLAVGGQYAGQVYLGGDGRLWYWDIFNRQVLDPGGSGDKFYRKAMNPDDYRGVRLGFILEVEQPGSTRCWTLDGRGFGEVRFRGEYPIGTVTMRDSGIPVAVELEAFSPFIPTDDADSGIPATLMIYHLTNRSRETLTVRVGGWLENTSYREAIRSGKLRPTKTTLTEATGVLLSAGPLPPSQSGQPIAAPPTDIHDAGSMAIALLGRSGNNPETLPEPWQRALHAVKETLPRPEMVGMVRSETLRLAPGASAEFRFALCWHFPNIHRGTLLDPQIQKHDRQRNYYAKTYRDAAAVAGDLARRHQQLVAATRLWRDTWYDSTLPYWFLDRTFLNASTLATTACYRLYDAVDEQLDGRVYFWEGVYLGRGTCTHVTHYEQAFGRLFPNAARAQRRITDYGVAWDDRLGYVRYRAESGIGGESFGIPHAIDGHAGTVLRTWREHTTSNDDSFLRSVWPRVKRATQFMIDQDAGRGYFADLVPPRASNQPPDGILEGPQYNTLDKYWTGVVPWLSGMYLASLRASAAMAEEVGDRDFARECTRIADAGLRNLTDATFNKDYGYFVHHADHTKEHRVNTNIGCHVDQVLGQSWAFQAGLPRAFPKTETRSALAKLFEHNLYARVGDYRKTAVIPCARIYADDDEPGFLICTFPHGGAREAVPKGTEGWDALVVGYFSECMTGFTYHAAAAMISDDMVTEGLALCRAIHDRYAEAPLRRNPFNEIEYGNHYTRAMASYAAFVSITGYEYHGPHGHIGFAPRLSPQHFKSAFTAAEGWGSFAQEIAGKRLTATLHVAWGRVSLQTIALEFPGEKAAAVTVNGAPSQFHQEGPRILVQLPRRTTIPAGHTLSLMIE